MLDYYFGMLGKIRKGELEELELGENPKKGETGRARVGGRIRKKETGRVGLGENSKDN